MDPLKFRDERKYVDRLKEARAKAGLDKDGHHCRSVATLTGLRRWQSVQDFAFMGGSLGMAAGEGIVTAMFDGWRTTSCR